MTDRDDLARAFEGFANWADDTSPLYARLARGVADDDDLLALAAEVPEGKSPPHLLLAGVHALLLAGVDDDADSATADDDGPDGAAVADNGLDPAEADPGTALAAYYPTVVDDACQPEAWGDVGDPVEPFRSFALAHRDELVDVFTRRRTQTNAVGRCAALYPALSFVAERVGGEPFELLELGASAGLNLRWDAYRYEYERAGDGPDSDRPDGDAAASVVGDVDAPVTVRSRVRAGDPPLPASPPPVADRLGVDLDPLDPGDPADARWLRALVWPEHERRHRRLAAALDAAVDDPPPVRQGDAVELLPELLAEIPDDRPVCVVTTNFRYQLDDADERRLLDRLEAVAAERPLHYVAGAETLPDQRAMALTWTAERDGAVRTERIGRLQQHGAWIAWDRGRTRGRN